MTHVTPHTRVPSAPRNFRWRRTDGAAEGIRGWNPSGSHVVHATFALLFIPFTVRFAPQTEGRSAQDAE
ncbi:hypothetical protein BJF83_18635 [Nocardiopsis sp. CNR-923]|uniref:hypothetical protein n=1 Tax=Nocardiopsis sp. CNR-923 TaxID=1904965 RepID=UPI0009606497|nr:hypothetical protein [Nocardiopsis sp. CNR-923]OLT27206.1 hypothetical protein BJF83_18635 [Nocardiopsis sp. CNR-923]